MIGWGQHDTVEVANYALSLDSTRVMDAASGWTDYPVSHLVILTNSAQHKLCRDSKHNASSECEYDSQHCFVGQGAQRHATFHPLRLAVG